MPAGKEAAFFTSNTDDYKILPTFCNKHGIKLKIYKAEKQFVQEVKKGNYYLNFIDGNENEDNILDIVDNLNSGRDSFFTVLLLQKRNLKLLKECARRGLSDFLLGKITDDQLELILAKASLAKEFGEESVMGIYIGARKEQSRKSIVSEQLPQVLKGIPMEDIVQAKLDGIFEKNTDGKSGRLLSMMLKEVEKSVIKIALTKTERNIVKTSRMLGMNRNTLSKKLKDYKI